MEYLIILRTNSLKVQFCGITRVCSFFKPGWTPICYRVLRDNEVNSAIIPGNGLQNLSGTFHTECFYETLDTLFTWQGKKYLGNPWYSSSEVRQVQITNIGSCSSELSSLFYFPHVTFLWVEKGTVTSGLRKRANWMKYSKQHSEGRPIISASI